MNSRTYTPPHPIVFICDYENLDAEIPEYDPESVASATNSCISVRTVADVDGDVTITLASTMPETMLDSCIEVFDGTIEVPNRQISVMTSEDEQLLTAEVSTSVIRVKVFVDNELNPERIWVAPQ